MALVLTCKYIPNDQSLGLDLMLYLSFFSMKMTSKRRRTKQQIIDEKAAALAKEMAMEEKIKLFEKLQKENAQFKAQQQIFQ